MWKEVFSSSMEELTHYIGDKTKFGMKKFEFPLFGIKIMV